MSSPNSKLDQILSVLKVGIDILGGLYAGNPTSLEQALLSMVQKSVSAYEAQTGKAIDPSLIKPIEHV